MAFLKPWRHLFRGILISVSSDKQSEFTDSSLRVYLQIRDKAYKAIFLIDIKCTMDIMANVGLAHCDNIAKYSDLRIILVKLYLAGRLY